MSSEMSTSAPEKRVEVYVKIIDIDDFTWLKNMIYANLVKATDNPGAYPVDLVATLNRVYESLSYPLYSIPTNVTAEAPAKPRKVRKKRTKSDDKPKLPVYCEEHPTYGAIRVPRTDCPKCWAAFGKLNPNRVALEKRKRGIK